VTLADEILTDMPVFTNTDEFGKTITIGGETVEATVILDDPTPNLDLDSRQGQVLVAVADLSSAPTYRTVIVIAGETWLIFRDNKDQAYQVADGMYIIPIYKDERVQL